MHFFEVLVQEQIRVSDRSSSIFPIAFIHNIQTHTRWRHFGRRGSVSLQRYGHNNAHETAIVKFSNVKIAQ